MYMPTITREVSLKQAVQETTDGLTMDRESLDNSTDDHDARSAENRPPAAEAVVDHGDEGERQNGAERVSGRDDALEGTLRVFEVWTRPSQLCSSEQGWRCW